MEHYDSEHERVRHDVDDCNEAKPMMGDCFDKCAKMLLFHEYKFDVAPFSMMLCHGLVRGTNGIVKGRNYTHAWLEFRCGNTGEHMVHDPTNGFHGLRDIYYSVGNVQLCAAYNYHAATNELSESGHTGPWNSYVKDYDPKHNPDLLKHYQQTEDTPDED